MLLCGKPYSPQSPLDSGSVGIGTVVQELGLVDDLPVGVNIFMGRTEPFSTFGVVNMRKLYGAAEALFEKWGFQGFPVRTATGRLSVEEKKIVELIRALSRDPDLLILDEITQALSLNYRKALIGIIGRLRNAGKSILLVTHDIEEMVEITDRITIMRDGKIVAECDSRETSPGEVKRLMVGRELEGAFYRDDTAPSFGDEVVLRAEGLTSDYFKDISFDLHKGEILGFCGLSDAGIHELAESLFAVRRITSGRLTVTNANTTVQSPLQAMGLSMGYVPKDRDKQALMVNDSIQNNIGLAAVSMTRGWAGFLSPELRRSTSSRVIQKFAVKANNIDQPINGLSGGNRQNVNLGRWLVQEKDILILDCPTRGVDVGVKSSIYGEMVREKQRGVSMVVVSDELPELIGMCDTLIVMKSGKVTKTITRGPGMTEENIIEVML
jgi:ribose transport system ATP-binding protein